MNRPFIPHRVEDAPCVLDGNRFQAKVCRRCGYRRNAAAVMPRYAMCDDPHISMENPYRFGVKRVIPIENNAGTE